MRRGLKYRYNESLEMACLRQFESGLPYDVWIGSNCRDRKARHKEPKLLVIINSRLIPVVISQDDPHIPKIILRDLFGGHPFRDFALVRSWIIKNYGTLIKHWNQELTDREALTLLTQD